MLIQFDCQKLRCGFWRASGLDDQCNGRAWLSGDAQRGDLLGARGQRQQRDLSLAEGAAILAGLGKAQLPDDEILKQRANIQRTDLEWLIDGDGQQDALLLIQASLIDLTINPRQRRARQGAEAEPYQKLLHHV